MTAWEAEMKAQAQAQYMQQTCGEARVQEKTPYRPSLLDNLNQHINAGVEQNKKAAKAVELRDLLHKNPDVARILELLKDFQ